jgi:hypothetical protein
MFNSIHEKNPFLKGLSYTIILTVGIFLATFLLGKTITEFRSSSNGGDKYPARTISVSGIGEVITTPDVAVFTFDVREEGDTVEQAQDIATTKINKISDLLIKSGIVEGDIKTTSYNVNPKYEWVSSDFCVGKSDCNDRKQEINGYEVYQSTEIKIREIDLAGEMISSVGGLGVAYISGLQFVIDEDKDFQEEARNLAILDAKEKAKNRADILGVKLGDLVSFYEDNEGEYPEPMYRESFSVSSDKSAPKLSPGNKEVKSRVTIVFEIK